MDPTPVAILLLEDSVLDAELIGEHLRRVRLPHSLERVAGREEFRAALGARRYDLILADYVLPGFDGMAALDIAREAAPHTPFIFVSGTLGEEVAIESLKRGATDYVVKQRLQRLPAAVERALAEARERAERRRAEERQNLLVAELSHRVKNTLTTVLSIAQQTLHRSDTLAGFEAAFTGRLQALADAHALLFRMNWGDTALRDLIEQALLPFRRPDGGNVSLDGPAVRLPPPVALTLSLILHELATNAAKYGALGAAGGRAEIAWSVEGEGAQRRLRLRWAERGGPPVQPPSRQGFGSALIRRSISYELDGDAELSFPVEGVICDISFPLPEPAPAA